MNIIDRLRGKIEAYRGGGAGVLTVTRDDGSEQELDLYDFLSEVAKNPGHGIASAAYAPPTDDNLFQAIADAFLVGCDSIAQTS